MCYIMCLSSEVSFCLFTSYIVKKNLNPNPPTQNHIPIQNQRARARDYERTKQESVCFFLFESEQKHMVLQLKQFSKLRGVLGKI